MTIASNGGSITGGQPQTLFNPKMPLTDGWPQYDESRDGRFLVNVEIAETTPPITLLQNWNPAAKK